MSEDLSIDGVRVTRIVAVSPALPGRELPPFLLRSLNVGCRCPSWRSLNGGSHRSTLTPPGRPWEWALGMDAGKMKISLHYPRHAAILTPSQAIAGERF
jgi:hypothetical protein